MKSPLLPQARLISFRLPFSQIPPPWQLTRRLFRKMDGWILLPPPRPSALRYKDNRRQRRHSLEPVLQLGVWSTDLGGYTPKAMCP